MSLVILVSVSLYLVDPNKIKFIFVIEFVSHGNEFWRSPNFFQCEIVGGHYFLDNDVIVMVKFII